MIRTILPAMTGATGTLRPGRWLPGLLAIGLLALAACSPSAETPPPAASTANGTAAPTGAAAAAPTATAQELPTAESSDQAPAAQELAAQAPPPGADREFRTDFSKTIISYDEVLSGGPPKDGIPAIDEPQFVAVAEADAWLEPVEPVVRVQVGDDARAYPLQILTWHEIVNDTVGDQPVAVTFCPLCNTAIVFARTVAPAASAAPQVLDFGTTGRLRFSNLIMYDRQTETWWQQATGEALAGELVGTRLDFVPGEIIAWSDFRATHPDGQVLSRETGFNRSYGNNPYLGYDDVNNTPFLYQGEPTPDNLPAVARVLTIEEPDDTVAYPFEVLQEVRVVNDTVGDQEVVIFWEAGTASALDAGIIAEGRDVGAANAYLRTLNGEVLTFAFANDEFRDEETGSVWNARGEAISGPLAGEELQPAVAINHFWFSWAAFRPETRIYQPAS